MGMSEFRTWLEARDRETEVRSFQRNFGVFGNVERRMFPHSVGETRQAGTSETGSDDGSLQVIGHAAVFGKPSVELMSPYGSFTEYIHRTAFDNVLKSDPDVLLTWDHDTRYVLGRTSNSTLDLSVESGGLRYWSRVAPTSYAADLRVLMNGGYLSQSSFLFRIAKGGEDWSFTEDAEGNEVVSRTVMEVGELFDVCVCAAGAYPQTDSGIARTMALEYARTAGYVNERRVISFNDVAIPENPETLGAWHDPEKRDSVKLVHHSEDGVASVELVKSAMSKLNRSIDIPDTDRQGVYNHLRKHYAQFGETTPELRNRVEIEDESRRVTDELRALGDVAWGPEEGTNDLIEDLEEVLNGPNPYNWNFSVCDVAVTLDKAIVCDWDDYTFWVVPFSIVADGDPVVVDSSEWVMVETAWVTTAEGYEANIRSAKVRREARMAAETETAETPEILETPEVATEVEETPADIEATHEEEAAAEAVESDPADPAEEPRVVDVAKVRLLAETRARLARAKTI